MNNLTVNKIKYYMIIIALYTVSFVFLYRNLGGIAGGIAVVFLFIISFKSTYIDIISLGIIITTINIFIKFKFFSDYKYYELTILNHLIIIIVSLLIVHLIKKERLIKKQCADIQKSNLRLRELNNGLHQEIAQRIRTEKALKESESQFRHAVEDSPVPAILYSEDGEIIKISRSWTDITGYTIKDIPTIHHCLEMVNDLKKSMLDIDESSSLNLGQRQYNGEYFIKTKDGDIRVWDSYSSCIGTLYDGRKLLFRVATDITERKRMEELERSMEEERKILNELKEYDRIKTEFFANLSHEFRTPIHVIFSAIQLHELKLQGCSSENTSSDSFKYTNIMKQNCYRLLRLVNNLIDITKIDVGYFELNEINQDIVSLIENITLSVADYIESKGLSLVFDTDVEEKILACDTEKIERIIMNLLSNAVKFTPFGGNIIVTIEDGIESVCIRIKDTGRGIPVEKLNCIFERFVQIDKSLARDKEGSGVGLSLVKSLVELHGGTISVKSKEEYGTEFIIYIPCKLIKSSPYNKVQYSYALSESSIERINIEFSDIYN